MVHIIIERTMDYNSCETCGGGSDEGGSIWVDEVLIWHKEPVGSCYGGEYLDEEFYYRKVLEHLGHTLEVD